MIEVDFLKGFGKIVALVEIKILSGFAKTMIPNNPINTPIICK